MYELTEFKFQNNLNRWDYNGGLDKNIPFDTDVRPLKLSTEKRKQEKQNIEKTKQQIEPIIALHRESDNEFELKRSKENYNNFMTSDYFFQILVPIIIYLLICIFRWQIINDGHYSLFGIIIDILLLRFHLWGFFATIITSCLLVFLKARSKVKYAKRNNKNYKDDPLYKKAKETEVKSAVVGIMTTITAGQIIHEKVKNHINDSKKNR